MSAQRSARKSRPPAPAGGDRIAPDARPATGRDGPPRRWGGRTSEQRRTERRARLLAAALEIWLEHGWAAVTMRGVCGRTALNDRYFYEHFADRDELLAAVWDDVCTEVFTELSGVVADGVGRPPLETLHAAVARAVELQLAGPARILCADHAGSAILEVRRSTMLTDATDWLMAAAEPYLRPGVDPLALRMSTLMGIGGFLELLAAWRAGTVDVDAQRIITHTGAHATVLSAQYLEIAPS
ncbi:TetR/AcrR family transcriptional regulator [Nocardia vermiculata]|uniref:TetR/AcrR family transcriptional regulator n=1 Tax=Nocardia vermiculata TaxID=257274 RepID=A0A846XY07_9NOCA|nr:TetR/AcrR family transcriptional regulator [Nocardia vermiculata]NKY50625.1 TetR/AcrR family transcriptional regulator [Nocardia vermiculata]